MEEHYIGDKIRKYGVLTSKNDSRVPNNWSQYSYKDNGKARIFLVCRHRVNNELCIFAVGKDTYLDDKNKFEGHECRIKNIDQYFPQEEKEITDIDESTINFIGKNQLPLNLVTKTSFREFASNLIILGQKNPQAKPENLFPSVSRQTFTKHFIHYSDKSFKKSSQYIKKSQVLV